MDVLGRNMNAPNRDAGNGCIVETDVKLRASVFIPSQRENLDLLKGKTSKVKYPGRFRVVTREPLRLHVWEEAPFQFLAKCSGTAHSDYCKLAAAPSNFQAPAHCTAGLR